MTEQVDVDSGLSEDGFVAFRAAGDEARGEFRCAACGYGAVVAGALPECPMCRSAAWEPVSPHTVLRRSPALLL